MHTHTHTLTLKLIAALEIKGSRGFFARPRKTIAGLAGGLHLEAPLATSRARSCLIPRSLGETLPESAATD
eukprot:8735600-Alexandrium_andersonii.AAC.1